MAKETDSEEPAGGRLRARGNVRERSFEVDNNFEGWRLDRYLANRIRRLSRTKASRIVRQGDLRMVPQRGARIKPSTRLQIGDVVILREQLEPEELQYEEVRWIYADEALLILDKPAGMLVHETSRAQRNTIRAYLEEIGEEEAEPAHRLDRETSGVLICARRRRWISPLRQMFQQVHPKKVYRALALDPQALWQVGQSRWLRWPLGFSQDSAIRIKMGRGDLEARTHVRVLSRLSREGCEELADLEVEIETGRQHQIRVHLSMFGTPVAGDKMYSMGDAFFIAWTEDGADQEALLERLPCARQALHAWRLEMDHPATGQRMCFEAPLPALWEGL